MLRIQTVEQFASSPKILYFLDQCLKMLKMVYFDPIVVSVQPCYYRLWEVQTVQTGTSWECLRVITTLGEKTGRKTYVDLIDSM